MRVGIIGAGLTGLTAGAALKASGLSPVLFDKGRGVGGRLATRRADGGLQFDHGAQYLSPKDAGFRAFLEKAMGKGAASTWTADGTRDVFVGQPGMSGIAKVLAEGIDIRQGIEVGPLNASPSGWRIGDEVFDRVICTVPAPQAIHLVGNDHEIALALQNVTMEPNLTLMLAIPSDIQVPFITRRDANDDIAWLALDTEKTGRSGPQCWVAQASLEWSRSHLELTKEQITDVMLPLVCDRLGVAPSSTIHCAAHRWRYAFASQPLGAPFLSHQDTLFVGGDWALSKRAEGAWLSGGALANAVLASR